MSCRPWIRAARRSPTTFGSRGSLDGNQCDSPPLATTRTRPGKSLARMAAPSAVPSATQRSMPGSGGAAVLTTSGTSGIPMPPHTISYPWTTPWSTVSEYDSVRSNPASAVLPKSPNPTASSTPSTNGGIWS